MLTSSFVIVSHGFKVRTGSPVQASPAKTAVGTRLWDGHNKASEIPHARTLTWVVSFVSSIFALLRPGKNAEV
jgi:hypothetical protein